MNFLSKSSNTLIAKFTKICQVGAELFHADKHDETTRVVRKVMSNFFLCMQTGNSRRRRVWW